MPEQPVRARLVDVAHAAGVSKATVSKVLNGRQDLSVRPETRRRVHEAAEALGYRPHSGARALAGASTHALAKADYRFLGERIVNESQPSTCSWTSRSGAPPWWTELANCLLSSPAAAAGCGTRSSTTAVFQALASSFRPWCGQRLPGSQRDRWFDELVRGINPWTTFLRVSGRQLAAFSVMKSSEVPDLYWP